MRQRIRLTESDLKHIVMRVLRESIERTERVPEIYDVYEIAAKWAEAAKDRMNGGQGVSKYNGRTYTVEDWKATLYFSNFRVWALGKETGGHGMGGESIKAAIGKEIKSMSQTKSDKNEIKKARAEGRPIPPEIADKPNKYVKPDSSFYEDVYSSFFYGSGLNTKSATGMDAGEHLENMGFDAMSSKWLEPRKDGKEKTGVEYANQMSTALKIYAIHYFRLNSAEILSNASGNLNLTDTDNDKDKEQFKGDNLSTTYNTNIGDYDQNLDDEEIDSTFDMPDTNTRMEAREEIRGLFESLLEDFNSDITQFHQGFTKVGGKPYPVTKPYLVYTVKYIVDHFDELFDEETLDMLIPDSVKAMKDVAAIIRDLTARFVSRSYDEAIRKKQEDPTYTSYVLDMFPVRDLNAAGKVVTTRTKLNDPNVAITPTQFQACLSDDMDKLYAYVLKHLNDYFWHHIGVRYRSLEPTDDLTPNKRNSPRLGRDRENGGQKLMKPVGHGLDIKARKDRKDKGLFPLDLSEPYDLAQYERLYNKLGPQGLMKKYNLSFAPDPKSLKKAQSDTDAVVNEAIRRIKRLGR